MTIEKIPIYSWAETKHGFSSTYTINADFEIHFMASMPGIVTWIAEEIFSPSLSRSFHKYAHVFLGSGRGLKLGKKAGEVAPGECPLEGLTEDLPMILEV